jgi:hypothetical protein
MPNTSLWHCEQILDLPLVPHLGHGLDRFLGSLPLPLQCLQGNKGSESQIRFVSVGEDITPHIF